MDQNNFLICDYMVDKMPGTCTSRNAGYGDALYDKHHKVSSFHNSAYFGQI